MPSLFDRLTNRIEIFRLESRYTRNRNRRSTFVSDTVYVDGEYVPASSQNTGSSYNSRSSRNTSNINIGNQGRRYNPDGGNDTGVDSIRDRVMGTEGTVADPYQATSSHKVAEKRAKRGSIMFTNATGEREEGGEERWGSNNPWASQSRQNIEQEMRESEIQRAREEAMDEHKRASRASRRWSKAFMPAPEEEKAVKQERRRTMRAVKENWLGTGVAESKFVTHPEMIKIVVGKEKKEFTVHKFLLAEYSKKFAAQSWVEWDGFWNPAFSEDDPVLFGFVVEWLYEHRAKPFTPLPWDSQHMSVVTYCKLWMYGAGEQWAMPHIQNHVMKQLHAWRMEAPEEFFFELYSTVVLDMHIIGKIYYSDDDHSRDWITNFCAYHAEFAQSFGHHCPGDYHETLMYEVLRQYALGIATWEMTDPSKDISDFLSREN